MAEETDGVGETFDDSLRVALTVASQFGERIARLREQLARQRESDSVQEARELTARFEAERGAMRASLAPVQHSDWWENANPQDIATVHETATAWRDFDDVAHGAADTIKQEVRQRYDIDVDAPGADAAAVAAALSQAERDRAEAAAERTRSGEELAASQLLFAQADRRDREAQESEEQSAAAEPAGTTSEEFDDIIRRNPDWTESKVGAAEREQGSQEYDSAERRHRFAASLEDKGIDQKTIAARLLAEGENAQHPRQAVEARHGGAAKIRKSKSTSAQQRTRGGLSR
ncbi:hypothetical protein [Cryobacterium arcticum]|uniref:Colicin import membrane protein n=1 Tax=Cryobacterium arcticum TaxID=670052 RepID=A0A1B1BQM5_9MICO|nr:hypothetical protein [Cryobacterium arcticum]ANP74874.1 hypothetical protein PA27867_3967 [Cryobacterium arcticum]